MQPLQIIIIILISSLGTSLLWALKSAHDTRLLLNMISLLSVNEPLESKNKKPRIMRPMSKDETGKQYKYD